MGSIRVRPENGALFMDFKHQGRRLREQTTLPLGAPLCTTLQRIVHRARTPAIPANPAPHACQGADLTALSRRFPGQFLRFPSSLRTSWPSGCAQRGRS